MTTNDGGEQAPERFLTYEISGLGQTTAAVLLDRAGRVVADLANTLPSKDRVSYALLIVRCVNSHEALVKALQSVIDHCDSAQGQWAAVTETYAPEWTHPYKHIQEQAQAALAGEKEQTP